MQYRFLPGEGLPHEDKVGPKQGDSRGGFALLSPGGMFFDFNQSHRFGSKGS